MTKTTAKVPADLVDAITAGANPVIDLDEAHRAVLRRSASSANADAVEAEIEVDRLSRAIELLGDSDDAQKNLATAKRIAGERRRRATKLAGMAGIDDVADLELDVRLYVADQLRATQEDQVARELHFAHPDLFAATDDELALPRNPSSPAPVTVDVLRERAFAGRAQIAAYTHWLTEHAGDGPELVDDPNNTLRQSGVTSLRRFLGLKTATPDDDLEARNAAKGAEDPRLGHTGPGQ